RPGTPSEATAQRTDLPRKQRAPDTLAAMTDAAALRAVDGAGTVMVIGGAEDRFRDKVILQTFADLAGGDGGHVVVISTASSLGEAATEAYRELFLGLGIGRVSGIRP